MIFRRKRQSPIPGILGILSISCASAAAWTTGCSGDGNAPSAVDAGQEDAPGVDAWVEAMGQPEGPEGSSDDVMDVEAAATEPKRWLEAGEPVAADAAPADASDSGALDARAAPADAGECQPGSSRCSANGVQICGSAAAWGKASPCVHQVCTESANSAACSGQCGPGDTSCMGAVPQSCTPEGTWTAGLVVSGTCGAVCNPNDVRCDSTQQETCTANGAWGAGTVTANVCGACSPGGQRCNATVPQTCDSNGVWQSGAVTSGTCSAICTPGQMQCDHNGGANLPQTCDSTGSTWVTGNVTAGVCGAACSLGDTQCCNANTAVCGKSAVPGDHTSILYAETCDPTTGSFPLGTRCEMTTCNVCARNANNVSVCEVPNSSGTCTIPLN
jgi:hypothetical protein